MAIEIVMPQLGWTMEEGVFGEWLKQEGDQVEPGDLLFVVETDKATQEVEAFDRGILHIPSHAPQPGTTVPVGAVLAYLLQPGEAWSSQDQDTSLPAQRAAAGAGIQAAGAARHDSRAVGRHTPAISPRARRVAAELNVDWRQLKGSGSTGRIVERDVRAAAEEVMQRASIRATPVARRMAEYEGIDLDELGGLSPGSRVQRRDVAAAIAARNEVNIDAQDDGGWDVLPVTPIRQTIARRMLESVQTTAAVTLHTEADATDLVDLRRQIKRAFDAHGRRVPTYTDLLIKLTATALQIHPALNASWQDGQILRYRDVHMGFAVDTEAGLLAPVLRNAQRKGVQQIAAEAAELAERARTGQLSAAEMAGGTFTLTNLGMAGIDHFTPLLNLPQAAILGVGRIVLKPAVHDGEVVPRQCMALSLTFDHRVVDGGPAARFFNQIREFVEQPYVWLVS